MLPAAEQREEATNLRIRVQDDAVILLKRGNQNALKRGAVLIHMRIDIVQYFDAELSTRRERIRRVIG